MTKSKNPETIVLHAGHRKDASTNAVAVPIYQTTSYQFDSTEHTAYSKNRCIDRSVNAYLLRGTLPPEGTVCTA